MNCAKNTLPEFFKDVRRCTTDVVATRMGLKNAGYGNTIEPEECMAQKNAWRTHGFKEFMAGNKNEPERYMALKNAWRKYGLEECMEDAWL